MRASLDDPERSLPAAPRAQAARLRAQIVHEQRLVARLESLPARGDADARGAAKDVVQPWRC